SAFGNSVSYLEQAVIGQVRPDVVELATEEESQVVAFVKLCDPRHPRGWYLQFGGPEVLRVTDLGAVRKQLLEIAGRRGAIGSVEYGGGSGKSDVGRGDVGE